VVTLVRVDGWPVAPAVAGAFMELKAAFDAVGFRDSAGNLVTLHVFSGYRSYEEQKAIFLDRYVPIWEVGGRHVYDYRWWNGIQYARISGGGTVAQPGTSNHGDGRALDIRDSGVDAGVTRYRNERSEWIRKNAPRFGFYPDGYYNFNEPWHIRWDGRDPWAEFLSGHPELADLAGKPEPITNYTSEEDEMLEFVEVPGKAGARKGGLYAVTKNPDGSLKATFVGPNSEWDFAEDGHLVLQTQTAADRLMKVIPGLR